MGARCTGCGSEQVAERWDASRIAPGKTIAWCAACGLGRQDPLPTPAEIRHYYDNFPVYNLHGAGEKESLFAGRLRRLREMRPQRGRLLDVGAGLGHFLELARNDGWTVAGVEPQAAAAEQARRELGVEVHVGFLHDLALQPGSFDVVTLWDVLEHVHEPLRFLDACLALLRPTGLLVLAVPNASGVPARMFRGHWRYVMFTHLSYFTMEYLFERLSERGWSMSRTTHTVKAQSLLGGTVETFGLPVSTERLIRAGRAPEDGDEGARSAPLARAGGGLVSGVLRRARRGVMAVNRLPLPAAWGDLVDVYAEALPM